MWTLLSLVFVCGIATANYPVFDYTTRMRILLLPSDIRPGTVIYRLRGTDADFDYPLRFDVSDDVGKSIIRVENMPCTPTHTYCQANVFLIKKLEADRVYDFILSLTDTTGRETKVDATIKATKASTRFEDIFPYAPTVLMVPEDTKIGTTLQYVLARKNPLNNRHAYLELWGSEKFRIVQNLVSREMTNGTVILTGSLDYEEKAMFMLTIYALDPYTEPREDTRNIAGFPLAVIVEDVQDMPPVFSAVAPVTKLKVSTKPGTLILKVHAQDGDRGNPRLVRYGFVSEKNPFTTFFNISEKTGEITLARPIKELAAITRNNQPIILTVMAEEVKTKLWEPAAMTATVQVALILEGEVVNSAPYFENQQYVTRIIENAPQGTALTFSEPYSDLVKDDDLGKAGVFSLTLEGNNGTFEVSPSVGERRVHFIVRVRNNALLDFEERSSVSFRILAKELSPASTSKTSKANVTVYLDDQNDNPPVFVRGRYEAVIPENVTAGIVVTQVQATDIDTGVFGKVSYTNILGNANHSLNIDSSTGLITVATNNHGFDREAAEEYRLTVEARDLEGAGNRATAILIIKLLDVNDQTPEFERQVFEFILQPGLKNFTSRAFVKATDRDAEPPNNVVRYEIMSGNYENKFYLNEVTGELFIRGRLQGVRNKRTSKRSRVLRQADYRDEFYDPPYTSNGGRSEPNGASLDSVIVLTVRAYDLGIPHRWQHAHVRIYPPESRARNMNFIVSGSNPDRRRVEELLRQLTGGRVIIQDIRPYTGQEVGTDLSWRDTHGQQDKSVVVATIFYEGNSYVDVNQLETRLTANKTQAIVDETVRGYRSENRVLIWLLIFLLILVMLAVLILVLCCLWQGCWGCCPCPWPGADRRRLVSPSEGTKLILRERGGGKDVETKGVQAVAYSGRKEAWSAENESRSFQYNRRNGKEKMVRQMNVEGTDDVTAAAAAGSTFRSHGDLNVMAHGPHGPHGPKVIYSNEFIRRERDKHPTMLIEDVEVDPYHEATANKLISGGRLRVHADNDPDSDSMRRHELERGSDLGKSMRKSEFEIQKAASKPEYHRIEVERDIAVRNKGGKEYRVVLERGREEGSDDEILDLDQDDTNRDQYYIKDGNAEILRLVTRGNQEERPRTLVTDDKAFIRFEKGKEIIMKRFMEDQKQSREDSADLLSNQLLQRLRGVDQSDLQEYLARIFTQNQDASYINDMSQLEDRGFNLINQETQSLPGQVEMSTQTEREFGTQTDELSLMRPPRRKVRSDNEVSDEDVEDNRFQKAVTALNLGKGWVRRTTRENRGKSKRYKIKTPILEEAESANESIKFDSRPAMFKMPDYELIINGTGPGAYTENKSSILRRRKLKEKIYEENGRSMEDDSDFQNKKEESSEEESIEIRKSENRKSRRDSVELVKKRANDSKETPSKLVKINEGRRKRAESLNRLYNAVKELEDQELESIRLETRQRTSSLNRLYNALKDLEEAQKQNEKLKRTKSLSNLSKKSADTERSFHDLEDENDRSYMRRAGFYKRIKDLSSTATESTNSKPQESTETSLEELRNKKNINTVGQEVKMQKNTSGGKHVDPGGKVRVRESLSEPPKQTQDLSQNPETFGSAENLKAKPKRSKYMDWYKNLDGSRRKLRAGRKVLNNTGRKEDDLDSGIAMSSLIGKKMASGKNPLEKKSVFTIAYDEMETKNIRPDTNASQRL